MVKERRQYRKFCVAVIRPKGTGRDVFESILGRETGLKKTGNKNKSKKEKKGVKNANKNTKN